MRRLEGKTAIITGASRGIGQGIALCLAREGANLVLGATKKEHLKHCMEQAGAFGVKCMAIEVNVADPAISEEMATCAVSEFQTLDIAVACAGINRDGMLHKMTDEKWQVSDYLQCNLPGLYRYGYDSGNAPKREGGNVS